MTEQAPPALIEAPRSETRGCSDQTCACGPDCPCGEACVCTPASNCVA